MIEQTYPSGRVVKNVLDNNGDLNIVQSKKNANFGFHNYAKNFTYNSAGAVTSMQLGNGRWESTQFNSRLQPTQIALGATTGASDLLRLDYSYGETNNNGNVLSQTITVPTVGVNTGFTAVQSYSYDSLNRIKDATENITPIGGSSSQSWKQTFTYDRYGNRNFDEANTTTLIKNCGTTPNFTVCAADRKVLNPEILASNNRIKGDQDGDSINDYVFDAAGNTTRDAQNRRFTYDAENKQIKVETVDGNGDPVATVGEYVYDGDGKRIKKIVPNGESVIFVYDAGGNLIAEYANQISQTPQVSYLTNDHLGSPRINTDAAGNIIARHDYHPFGEEIIGTGGRTQGLNYTADDVRKQFTGYERDDETDLDFAEARYLGSVLGRYTTPDRYGNNIIRTNDLQMRKYIGQPQNWNQYSYCNNNPLKYIDKDGNHPILALIAAAEAGGSINLRSGRNTATLPRSNRPGSVRNTGQQGGRGGSGKPREHFRQSKSKKEARDRSRNGRHDQPHKSRTSRGQREHFHNKNNRGENIHETFGKAKNRLRPGEPQRKRPVRNNPYLAPQ